MRRKPAVTIAAGLKASVTAFVALSVLMTAFWWRSIATLSTELDSAVTSTAVKLDLVGAMKARVQELGSLARGIQLSAAAGETARVADYRKQYLKVRARVYEQIAQQRALGGDETRMGLLLKVETAMRAWEPLHDEFLQHIDARRFDDAQRLMTERILPPVEQMQRAAQQLTEHEREVLVETRKSAQATEASARRAAIAIASLTLLLAVGVFVFVSRMVGRLSKAVKEIAAGAGEVSAAAAQVSNSAQSLSASSSEQAAALEETGASSQEVNSAARDNADHCRSASSLTAGSTEHANTAHEALSGMVAAVQAIEQTSDKISGILKVVETIAFQTNLLALNAAVEAARAGESGAGFAVVADEVRALAGRSAEATKGIRTLVEESLSSSKRGTEAVGNLGELLETLRTDATEVHELVEEMLSRSDHQSESVGQMAGALDQIGKVTQTVAATAEESAAASEELNAQAVHLDSVAAELQLLVGGDTSR